MMKKLVNKTLRMLGLRVSRLSSWDALSVLGNNLDDPVSVGYLNQGNGVVVSVPMAKGRGLPLFSYASGAKNPFVDAVRGAIDSPSKRKNIISTSIYEYYKGFCPANIAELLGIAPENQLLKESPAWSVVMPWDAEDIVTWRKRMSLAVLDENNDYKKGIGIDQGWAWTGPTSAVKCEIEASRLANVLGSIIRCGYMRHNGIDGDIIADLLLKSKEEWVWQSVRAQHRAIILSAMGHEHVPIRVRRVIRREDAIYWPNVRRGVYSREQAVKVFDNIYNGDYSHIKSEIHI